jgi:hypothetical protein
MRDFNEGQVRLFYRLLNHKGDTELRFIKRGMYPAFKVVKSEEDFVNQCKIRMD